MKGKSEGWKLVPPFFAHPAHPSPASEAHPVDQAMPWGDRTVSCPEEPVTTLLGSAGSCQKDSSFIPSVFRDDLGVLGTSAHGDPGLNNAPCNAADIFYTPARTPCAEDYMPAVLQAQAPQRVPDSTAESLNGSPATHAASDQTVIDDNVLAMMSSALSIHNRGNISHRRKTGPGHVKRPCNAFILFRSHVVAQNLIPREVEKDHRNISRIISHMWRSLSEDERKLWDQAAAVEKERHRKQHPDYKYRPALQRAQVQRRNVRRLSGAEQQCEQIADAILRAYGRDGVQKSQQQSAAQQTPQPSDTRSPAQAPSAVGSPAHPTATLPPVSKAGAPLPSAQGSVGRLETRRTSLCGALRRSLTSCVPLDWDIKQFESTESLPGLTTPTLLTTPTPREKHESAAPLDMRALRRSSSAPLMSDPSVLHQAKPSSPDLGTSSSSVSHSLDLAGHTPPAMEWPPDLTCSSAVFSPASSVGHGAFTVTPDLNPTRSVESEACDPLSPTKSTASSYTVSHRATQDWSDGIDPLEGMSDNLSVAPAAGQGANVTSMGTDFLLRENAPQGPGALEDTPQGSAPHCGAAGLAASKESTAPGTMLEWLHADLPIALQPDAGLSTARQYEQAAPVETPCSAMSFPLYRQTDATGGLVNAALCSPDALQMQQPSGTMGPSALAEWEALTCPTHDAAPSALAGSIGFP